MINYVIKRTTDGRFQGKNLEIVDGDDVLTVINELYDYEFKEIFNDGNKLVLTNDHIIVVLLKK